MRKWLTRLGLFVAGLIGLALIALVAAYVVVFHTGWGQDRLTRAARDVAGDLFAGGADIGAVRLAPSGEVVVEDVVIRDRAGRAAVEARRARVDFAWAPLLDRRFVATEIALEGVTVRASEGPEGWNLASLLADDDDEPVDDGPGWTVLVRSLRIDAARLEVRGAAASVDAAQLTVRAELVVHEGETVLVLDELAARVGPGQAPLSLAAQLTIDDAGVRACGVRVAFGGAVVEVPMLLASEAALAVAGSVEVPQSSQATLLALAPGLEAYADTVRGDISIGGTAWCQGTACQLWASGRVGTASIAAEADLDTAAEELVARFSADGLGPHLVGEAVLDPAMGRAALDVTGSASLGRWSSSPRGRATLSVRGAVREVPARWLGEAGGTTAGLDVVWLTAVASLSADGAATLQVGGDTSLGRLTASARAHRTSGEGAGWHLDHAAVSTTAPRIELALDSTPASGAGGTLRTGAATLCAGARGPIDALTVDASLVASDIELTLRRRVDGRVVRERVALARIEARAEASGVGAGVPARGKASLDLSNVRGRFGARALSLASAHADGRFWDHGRRARGSLRAGRLAGLGLVAPPSTDAAQDSAAPLLDGFELARVDVAMTDTPQGLRVTASKVRLDALGTSVRGGGTLIARGPRLAIEDLALTAPEARVGIDGVLVGRGALRADARVDLARLARRAGIDLATHLPPPASGKRAVRGVLEASVTVTREAHTRASALVVGRGLGVRTGAAPVDLTIAVAAGAGETSVNVELGAGGVGTAELAAATVAPADPLDPGGWKVLLAAPSTRQIRTAHLALRGLDVAKLLALAEQPDMATGLVDGDVDLLAGGDGLRFEVRARDIASPEIASLAKLERIEARAKGTWNRRALDTELTVLERGEPVFTRARLAAAVGIDAPLQTGFSMATVPVRADVWLRDFDLARLHRAGLVPEPVTGVLSATVAVRGTPGAPRVTVDDARIPLLVVRGLRTRDITLSARTTGTLLVAELGARQGRRGRLAARASVDLGPARTVGAVISAEALQLRFLRALATSPTDPLAQIAGRLDARMQLDGWPRAPRVKGTLTLERGALVVENGTRPIEDIEAEILADGSEIRIARLSARSGNGTVSASGRLRLAGDRLATVSVAFRTDELPVPAGDRLARVTTSGVVVGGQRGEELRLRVGIKGGTVEVSGGTRELADLGPLADVEYVRDGEPIAPRTPTAPPLPVVIAVVTDEALRVESPELDARVRANLTVRVDRGVRIRGNVRVVEGVAIIFERRYQIARGRVDFVGARPPDPRLDFELSHEFPVATVTLQVDGRASAPRLTMSSDRGGYGDAEILVIMLGGDPSDPTAGNRPLDQSAAGLANALTGELRQRLDLPVDVLRVRDDGFELGKWLTQKLLVGYRYRPRAEDRENRSEAILEWQFLDNWSLEGRFGDEDVGGLDVLWIWRK